MGIKRNVIYSTILTASNYIFPLIVYPYIARILGVTNIGLCNFIDNVINYFILFSMMGINIMGNRQIAIDRANNISLTKSFSSLLTINSVTTLIALVALILSVIFIPTLRENHNLMWFGAIKLIANFFLIEWFYKGIEDFRYITIRSIFVKSLYVIAIFIFVKESDDYAIYYLLLVISIGVNAIINIFYSRKYTSFSLKSIDIKRFLKPFFILGFYTFLASLCTTFNVVYLGFLTDDTQVGYFTTATKLYSILLAFFTGITTVMLPRMSNLLTLNKINEFRDNINKTTELLFAFVIPIIILSVIFAPQIILLISGPGYEGGITPMRIVMPLMLVIGYEQIAVVQGLMPLRADKLVIFNAAIGAVISVVLNVLLVPVLESIGSSVAWVVSEIVILILSQIAIRKLAKLDFPFRSFLKNIIANIPLAIIILCLYYISEAEIYWLFLIIATFIVIIYTVLFQIFILKNPLMLQVKDLLADFRKS